jgi:hypothetical protein
VGLALQIGFLRMSSRVLDAVRIVPPALWKHLGSQFGEKARIWRRCGRCFGGTDGGRLPRSCSASGAGDVILM